MSLNFKTGEFLVPTLEHYSKARNPVTWCTCEQLKLCAKFVEVLPFSRLLLLVSDRQIRRDLSFPYWFCVASESCVFLIRTELEFSNLAQELYRSLRAFVKRILENRCFSVPVKNKLQFFTMYSKILNFAACIWREIFFGNRGEGGVPRC